jgi:hypothetical protein
VYAARTSADERIATAEARLAEEIQRRRDAEAERDAARADREQADDATVQAEPIAEPCLAVRRFLTEFRSIQRELVVMSAGRRGRTRASGMRDGGGTRPPG